MGIEIGNICDGGIRLGEDAMEGHPDKGIEIGNICDGGIRLGEDTMEGHPDERGQYLSRISVFLEKASYHDIQV